MKNRIVDLLFLFMAFAAVACFGVYEAEAVGFPDIVARVKESVVGVGTRDELRRPQVKLLGSGFVVGDGYHIVTARHVVYSRDVARETGNAQLSVLVGHGDNAKIRRASVVYEDGTYDIAILKMEGAALPVLHVRRGKWLPDGTDIAIIGFPIGAVYGLYHATHRGYISATTPIARPQLRPSQLTPDMIRQLNQQLKVYQLDITSFPGNSGGPVFDIKSGEVVGLVNSTFVKNSKDKGLERPSGITFAMPAHYLLEVLKKTGVSQ